MRYTYIGCFLLSLLMAGCFSNDDDSAINYIDLQVEDVFVFDDQTEYVVGDTIFFSQKFSRYIKEEGYNELLDIFETTKDNQFAYSFNVKKFSDFSNTYVNVSIDPEYIITSGESPTDYFFYNDYVTVAKLNEAEDAYESRVGVVLQEIGSFQLDLSFVYFRNGFDYNNKESVDLDIRHRFTSPNDAYKKFEVVEQQ